MDEDDGSTGLAMPEAPRPLETSLLLGLEQFKKNCSRTFGAAEAGLVRRQLGTYVLRCPCAANGPSPPPALPNQRPPLFLKCSSPSFADFGEI